MYLYLMGCISICISSDFCHCICICIWNPGKTIFAFLFAFDKRIWPQPWTTPSATGDHDFVKMAFLLECYKGNKSKVHAYSLDEKDIHPSTKLMAIFSDTKINIMPSYNCMRFVWMYKMHVNGNFPCKIYWRFASTRYTPGLKQWA